MKVIELKTEKQLWDFLNGLYLLEIYDDANMYQDPYNAALDTLEHLEVRMPEWYNYNSKVIDDNWNEIVIWKYISEFSDYWIMNLERDWEYLSTNS